MYSSTRSIPLWLCSQIGAREHYAIPNALYKGGRLAGLVTDWYAPRNPVLRKLMSLRSKSALLARSEIIPDRLVHSFPLRSLLWKRRLNHAGRGKKSAEVLGKTDGAYAAAVAKLRLPSHDIFFGYSYGSLEILAAEKRRGVRTLLGQIDPGALECQLVAEEMSRFPELAGPPPEFPVSYYDRNRQEWELADRVVVNSAFSRDALIKQGVDPLKLVVIPLCFEPQTKTQAAENKILKPGEPLRVLFLGQVILRKGIHYLMKAASQLDPGKVHFDIVGPLGIKPEALAAAPRNVTFHGRSTRDQAATWYRQSDIFVLPTLSDGFAITQLEAMSYGLPVVTTPCCGEVVADGVDGFVIPPRSPEELVKAFQKYLTDPEILVAQRQAALRKASQFAMERLAKNLQDVEMSLF